MLVESVVHNRFDGLAEMSDTLGEGDRFQRIDASSCPCEGDYCIPSMKRVIAHSGSSFDSLVEVAFSFGRAEAVQSPSYAH
ncbi:hypothetical protein ASF76_11460 [Microbacterium sp. Leaf151]|nr:hypothetical protein ASF76_11460 [Microbacterium sp. Leaf151]